MVINSASASRFPWTWALLMLVTLDLICRANPQFGGLLPWIDATAVVVSLGVAWMTPKPAREHVSSS